MHIYTYIYYYIYTCLYTVEKARILAEDSVVIRDVEHLYYYAEFTHIFTSGIIDGISRFSTVYRCCIGCGYQLKTSDATFCYICGAYPAQ